MSWFELDLDPLEFFGTGTFPRDRVDSSGQSSILTLTLFVLAVLLAVGIRALLFACGQNKYRARSFDHFVLWCLL